MRLFRVVVDPPSREGATLAMAVLSRFCEGSIARLRYRRWRMGIVEDPRL